MAQKQDGTGQSERWRGSDLMCGICEKPFSPYEGMRKPATYGAPYWCKADQDEFDSIDWDEVRERALDGGLA